MYAFVTHNLKKLNIMKTASPILRFIGCLVFPLLCAMGGTPVQADEQQGQG
ncbi:MAG: hypothetical protein ACD_50C00087G0002, partial [uncultured bacterium]